MKKPGTKFRTHILIPLGVVLLLLLSASIVNTYRLQRLNISRDVQAHLEEVKQITLAHLAENSQVLGDIIELIKRNKNLQTAWLVKDREKLLRHAAPIFKDIYSKEKVTHFYFIDPDGVCFLRVHKPGSFGDTINHTTLNMAKREVVSASGIELGLFGTLTLRVVHPWWRGDELIGYVEIGVNIERLVPKLESILGSELIFSVDKSYLDRVRWEEGLKIADRSRDWDQFPNFVIANSMRKELASKLSKHVQFQISQKREPLFNMNMSIENRKYHIGFVPLSDVGGRTLGDIIVLKDMTRKESLLHIQLMTMITASAVIGVLMLGFFYFYVGRIEHRMVKSHDDLANEVAERKQAERALYKARDRLETRVQERTSDLKRANEQLQLELTEREKAEDEIRRLSQRLFSVIEEDRKRLTRDLHDELGQALTAFHFGIETLQDSLPEELKDQKTKCDELISIVVQQRDSISNIVSELRPDMLDHLGFIPTLEWYIENFDKQNERLQIDFKAMGVKKRSDPEIEIILYRILQEGLTNIAKHAKAEHVSVTLTYSYPNLIFVIKDNGIGFEQVEDMRPFGAKQRGIGLIGMRERVAAVGGSIDIRSSRGKGTLIRVVLPVSQIKVDV